MTRAHAHVSSAAGLVPFGHLGWAFNDRADFLACAAEYIADGLEQHQLITYVGDKSRDALQAEVASMPAIRDRSSDIQVTPIRDHYVFLPGRDVIDTERCVTNYVEGARQAIDDGYTGLRAVVDATAVARTAEQRSAMSALEYFVDHEMSVRPFSALCAYDMGELGPVAAELTCLHPFVGNEAPHFQIYAKPGVAFALTGQIDAACDEVFTTVLHRTLALTDDKDLVIDAQGLEFIDHRQLCMLDRNVRAESRTIVLRTDQPVPIRLARVLELTNLRVEPPG